MMPLQILQDLSASATYCKNAVTSSCNINFELRLGISILKTELKIIIVEEIVLYKNFTHHNMFSRKYDNYSNF